PALTITVAGLCTTSRAVYRPALQPTPSPSTTLFRSFTCQVTAVLLVFVTVAVNCCVPPAPTVADVGEIVTLTAVGAVMVTCAEADFGASDCDTAVKASVAVVGTTTGAVYRPALEIVPAVALPPG